MKPHEPTETATFLLTDFLLRSARLFPNRVALVSGSRRVTYGDVDDLSSRLAKHLVTTGIEPGDRAIIFGDNGIETAVAFWSALRANAVPSVVNPLTKADKLAYLLSNSGARALIADAHLTSTVRQALTTLGPSPEAAAPCTIVLTGQPPQEEADKLASLLDGRKVVASYDEATRSPCEAPPRRAIDVDLGALIYTSGSTGEPKGVMLTHKGMVTASSGLTGLFKNHHEDVILGALPLSFNYGLYQLIMAFQVGACLVLEKGFAFPAQVLKVMTEQKVTGFPGVPTIFAIVAELKTLKDFDLTPVRYITNTAAALNSKQIQALRTACPNAEIFSMYGLTECKRVSWLPPHRLADKPESVGIAMPNAEFWIVDENDQRVGPNVVGQIVMRSSTIMRDYWRKPEESARVLRPGPIPGEVVFYTGDLGRVDDEGFLYFVSRMDDIIKSRGEKVAPKEVELALCEIEGVKECAVIGVPDPVLGQAIKAFVVLEEGAALTEKQLRQLAGARLELFAVPKHFAIIEELPKTATGKIKKTDLR